MGTAHERKASAGKANDMSLFALRQVLPVRAAVAKLESAGRDMVTLAEIAAATPKRSDGKSITHDDLRKGITQFIVWVSLKGVGTPISRAAADKCRSTHTFGEALDRLITALGGEAKIEAATACMLPGGFQVQRIDNARHVIDADGTSGLLSRLCRYCYTYAATPEAVAQHLASKSHQRAVHAHPRYREGINVPAAYMTEWGSAK